VRGPGKFQRLYKRLKKRIDHGKTVVAVARRMLAIIFVLLTCDCEYEEKDDGNVRRKLRRMDRTRARTILLGGTGMVHGESDDGRGDLVRNVTFVVMEMIAIIALLFLYKNFVDDTDRMILLVTIAFLAITLVTLTILVARGVMRRG